MLRNLSAHGYAIIGDVSVDFDPGLNILTGETGAGKSIILGALGFVLGDQVSDDVVGSRSDSCRVEAFFAPAAETGRRLAAAGLLTGGSADQGLNLVRELARGGRSRCRVNGEAVPLKTMRAIGDALVDFHGQHEHQLLLRAERHVDFLDAFGGLGGRKEELGDLRRGFAELGKKVRNLEDDIEQAESRREFTLFEIDELEKLRLMEGEDEKLEAELKVLEHAEKIMELGGAAMELTYEGEDSAVQLIARARDAVERLAEYKPDAKPLMEHLDAADVAIREVAGALRSQLSGIDLEGADLDYMRDRLASIERVKRKYGETVPGILARLKRLKQSLDDREGMQALLDDSRAERDRKGRLLAEAALDLSARRRKASGRFEKMVEQEIRDLGIEGGAFKVVFEEAEEGDEVEAPDGQTINVGENGIDQVEFFVRTNPGENLLPLRRIASGGEISRVMLGLKSILAGVDEVGTLVFDEIDAGIGGGTADTVAVKLRRVSDSRQVICITHLPQIAVAGNMHLKVEKHTEAGRTSATVFPVEGKKRVEEIARMIDGRRPSASALTHAEQIFNKAARRKA